MHPYLWRFTLLFSTIFCFHSIVAQQPTIISFSPTSAKTYDQITIKGTNFINVTRVTIAGRRPIKYMVVDANTITAEIGAGATGAINVFTSSGDASLGGFTYIVTPPPVITSFSPLKAPVGSIVRITGQQFDPVRANNQVFFGNVQALISAATPTSLDVVVPPGATNKPISVTRQWLTGFAPQHFTATFEKHGGILTPTSFDTVQITNTSQGNYFAVAADFDLDGKTDVALSSSTSGTVNVFPNETSGFEIIFGNKVPLNPGRSVNGLCAGDLDMDGKPDLVIANTGTGSLNASVSIYHNNSERGSISFDTVVYYKSGNNDYSHPNNAAIGDLNADGRPDLVVVNGEGTVSVFRSESTRGNIYFASQTILPGISSAYDVEVGDLNGDGKPDIAVSNDSHGSISLFANTTSGETITFSPKVDYPAATGALGIALGYLDNDNRLDIAVATAGFNKVMAYRNTSTGGVISMAAGQDLPVIGPPKDIAIDDVDGDGKPDIASVETFGNITVLKNKSETTLVFDSISYSTNVDASEAIMIADLNHDGGVDLVGVGGMSAAVATLLNKVRAAQITSFSPTVAGPGNNVTIKGYHFTRATDVSFGGIFADSFTVTSDSEIVVTITKAASGQVTVFGEFGSGDAQGFVFNSSLLINSISPVSGPVGTTVTIKGANFSSVSADNLVFFPGSVRAEVISAGSNEIKVKSPAGSMFGPITLSVNHKSVVSRENYSTTFPSGALVFTEKMFSQIQDYAARMGNIEIGESDFDGDGKLDILTVNNQENADERSVSIWQNLSSPGKILLGDPQTFQASNSPMSAIAADINGDGKPDLIVANQTSYTVGVYKNISSGGAISLANPVAFPMGPAIQLASGDIDGDGRPDLVTSNFFNEFSIMRNNSSVDNISFDPQFYINFEGTQKRISLNDLNNDGRPEIIVTNSSDDLVNIYPNISVPGTIILGNAVTYPTGDGPYHGLVVADIDGNGWLDIITSNTNSNAISVLKNMSGKLNEFAPFVEFPLEKKPIDINASDLDGDGKMDFVTIDYESQQQSFISMLKNVSGTVVALSAPLTIKADQLLSGSCLGDLDGDGKPDIAVTNPYKNIISIYRNSSGEAFILPSGNNAVTGNIVQEVVIDTSVNSYQGRTYVQRHYHIEPEINPDVATATVTLYFSQQDFNNYNAAPNHGQDLPKSMNDGEGKSNLLILQFHGTSIGNQPAGYTGDTVIIDPDDSKIVWNEITGLWEVTFDVRGFSGFFVTSVNNSPAANDDLPLNIYPNPASQFVTVIHEAATENDFIRVVDLNGRSLLRQRLLQGSTQTTLDVRKLSPGLYVVAIYERGGRRLNKLILY
jgi:hypothetical protein